MSRGGPLFVGYVSLLAAAVAVAVWGSLFPFTLQPPPGNGVAAAFLAAWGSGPASWSRSDFLSNVLLFVPVGGAALAALSSRSADQAPGVRTPLAIVSGSLVLSVALELAQAYVPDRTASVVDALAEGAGTVIGMACWIANRRWIDAAMIAAIGALRRASPLHRALAAYCVLFAMAWLFPLDLTIRPGEIVDKYQHKRLLLPFSPSPDAASTRLLVVALIGSVPVGATAALWQARGRDWRDGLRAAGVAVTAAMALEALQVFVFSRTTDATMLLPVSAGIVVGVALTGMAGGEGCEGGARWTSS